MSVNIEKGGLYRCCVEAIEKYAPTVPLQGERFDCPLCGGTKIRYIDGAWRWWPVVYDRKGGIDD